MADELTDEQCFEIEREVYRAHPMKGGCGLMYEMIRAGHRAALSAQPILLSSEQREALTAHGVKSLPPAQEPPASRQDDLWLKGRCPHFADVPQAVNDAIDTLNARLDDYAARLAHEEKDAARYRWLRDPPKKGAYTHEYLSVCGQEEAYFGERLDAMIDAALERPPL